jgi:CDP-4-dehydro-6-deoxyglucose reductase
MPWGARSQSDLYLDEKVNNWQAHASCFNYFSSISDESKETGAASVIKKHLHDLKDWQIVLSGPFDMVYSARDVLVQEGIPASQLFSDAFNP